MDIVEFRATLPSMQLSKARPEILDLLQHPFMDSKEEKTDFSVTGTMITDSSVHLLVANDANTRLPGESMSLLTRHILSDTGPQILFGNSQVLHYTLLSDILICMQ